MNVYILIILAYLAALTIMNFWKSRKVKSQEDMMLAGRSIPVYKMVFTLICTWIGSGTFIAGAEFAAKAGWSAMWLPIGAWIGIVLIYFLAAKIRTFGQYTVGDILEERYGPVARVFGAFAIIVSFTVIVSYQFRGGSWVLNTITEGRISEKQGIIIVAAFVIMYTLLAGMLSVAYLDIFNGILMITAFFTAIPFLIHHVGGLDFITANLPQRQDWFLGNMSWLQAMGYFVPTLLLALGNGNMYQRFFSAKNEHEAKKSVIGWVIGVILLGIGIQSIAVIGSSYFKGLGETESGRIIVLAAFKGMPVVIGCLMMAAVVAIVISTANSFLLVPATNVVRDIYQRFINPKLPDKQMILFSRLVVIVLGVIAYSLISFFPRVLDAAYAAYTIYGAGITPALLAVFFWKRATVKGGVSSILGGMSVTILWEILNKSMGALPLGLPAVYPALLCSLTLLIVVSLVTPKPDPEKWRPFFKTAE